MKGGQYFVAIRRPGSSSKVLSPQRCATRWQDRDYSPRLGSRSFWPSMSALPKEAAQRRANPDRAEAFFSYQLNSSDRLLPLRRPGRAGFQRNQPFGRMAIGRMIGTGWRGRWAAAPGACPHIAGHSTGYARAARGMDTRRLQHFLGTPSRIPCATRRCRRSHSRISGADLRWALDALRCRPLIAACAGEAGFKRPRSCLLEALAICVHLDCKTLRILGHAVLFEPFRNLLHRRPLPAPMIERSFRVD